MIPTRTLAAGMLALSACSFSPLSHRIDVGSEPFLVFVGEGLDRNTDLFAAKAGGAEVAQVTFTSLIESRPALTPNGDVVAFLRMRDTLRGAEREVVLMNLISGGEFSVALPSMAGTPRALAWSPDATLLYIRTDRGVWQAQAPPDPPLPVLVPDAMRASADSALTLWVGEPRLARIVPCDTGGICSIGRTGDITMISPAGHDPMRWGSDSVAWFEPNGFEVRSLGPGRSRHVVWKNPPGHPREGTYAPGPAKSPS